MEKTIQMMKKNGLFDGLVHEIMIHGMPKDAIANILDEVCCADGNFEDTFFNDLHELGMSIIWKELCSEAEKRKVEDLKKEEMMNVVIVKQGAGRFLFACPECVNLKEGDRVLCDTKKDEAEGVCFTDSFKVNQKALDIIGKLLCATFPLKSVIGRCEVNRF
jgi:hypothetical protein